MHEYIPLYLVALIVAIAHTALNIYDVHARHVGTAHAEPWRSKASAGVTRATTAMRSFMAGLWGHRQALACAAVLVCLMAFPSLTAHAHGLTFVAVAGSVSNIDQLDRDLLKKTGEAAALLEKTARECQAHEHKDAEGKVVGHGRAMTAEEKKPIQALIDEGNAMKAQIATAKGDANLAAAIAKLSEGVTRPTDRTDRQEMTHVIGSLGRQFNDSDAGKFFAQKRHHGTRNWNSPVVELHRAGALRAATLTEGGASGGALVVTDMRPGILPILFKRLTVRDLLAPGTTDSNNISYMQETLFTNAAAAVAEGAAKPESELTFALVNELVQVIATWLPVTEQMLEDVSQIRSYIDARLKLGVELTEEDQLLNGNGTAPNISGILDRAGLTPTELRAGAVTNEDAIFIEMMKVFNASFVMPDGHVLNPVNWETIQLRKDSTGRYIGAGPFAGPQGPTLWGLPVAVTPSIAAGTGLTGSFKSSAQIFDLGNLRVDVSNSHSDFFIKNLVAIRAEERLALAVYRPAAFGTETGLT